MSNESTKGKKILVITKRKPVEVLDGRFEHFGSDQERNQHLRYVEEAIRNGAPF